VDDGKETVARYALERGQDSLKHRRKEQVVFGSVFES
jgi:hypothetical protein